jgi:hypothetical protein
MIYFSKSGDYQQACSVYEKIAGVCTLVDLCHMGLVLYKTGHLELESFQGIYYINIFIPTSEGLKHASFLN